MTRIVLSLSELSAACLVTSSTVYLRAGKSCVLNSSRSCFCVLRASRKLEQQTIFPFSFLNTEIFTSSLNLAETFLAEHVFKKEVNTRSVGKGLESQIPVWKVDVFILCVHTVYNRLQHLVFVCLLLLL